MTLFTQLNTTTLNFDYKMIHVEDSHPTNNVSVDFLFFYFFQLKMREWAASVITSFERDHQDSHILWNVRFES
jgi:hypothetical protein